MQRGCDVCLKKFRCKSSVSFKLQTYLNMYIQSDKAKTVPCKAEGLQFDQSSVLKTTNFTLLVATQTLSENLIIQVLYWYAHCSCQQPQMHVWPAAGPRNLHPRSCPSWAVHPPFCQSQDHPSCHSTLPPSCCLAACEVCTQQASKRCM